MEGVDSHQAVTNKVGVARDGQEALDYLAACDDRAGGVLPRVILLDLKLPKVDGLQVLREIRANWISPGSVDTGLLGGLGRCW